jgi:hypothetical protein
MLRNPNGKFERPSDPHFDRQEYLYRRVPDAMWVAGEQPPFELDAIGMPDMSVGRSKYGHPEWLRLERADFALWGVFGFRVGEMSTQEYDNGIRYHFEANHVPEPGNFPHSEVWAYRESLDKQRHRVKSVDDLPPDMYLAWREEIHRAAIVFLHKGQQWNIRDVSPKSHVPDLIPAEQYRA